MKPTGHSTPRNTMAGTAWNRLSPHKKSHQTHPLIPAKLKGSRKNNLAVSTAPHRTQDLTNAQFPMHNSQPIRYGHELLDFAGLTGRHEPLVLVRPPSVRIRIEHWELSIGN